MDAMGCQKSIGEQIIKAGGNYIFALKGNHGNTYSEVVKFYARHEKLGFKGRGYNFTQYETVDMGHDRIESRKITLLNSANWLTDQDSWNEIKSVVMLESERIIGNVSYG